jgi:hypothetical protein
MSPRALDILLQTSAYLPAAALSRVSDRRSSCHITSMATRGLKRPRDPSQLGKLIVDISAGQADDRAPAEEESPASNFAKKGGKARAAKLSAKRRKPDGEPTASPPKTRSQRRFSIASRPLVRVALGAPFRVRRRMDDNLNDPVTIEAIRTIELNAIGV